MDRTGRRPDNDGDGAIRVLTRTEFDVVHGMVSIGAIAIQTSRNWSKTMLWRGFEADAHTLFHIVQPRTLPCFGGVVTLPRRAPSPCFPEKFHLLFGSRVRGQQPSGIAVENLLENGR